MGEACVVCRKIVGSPNPVHCFPNFLRENVRRSVSRVWGGTFVGLSLSSTQREDCFAAITQGLVTSSSSELFCAYEPTQAVAKTVYVMGSLVELARAMHAAWAGQHRFVQLKGDSLEGLVLLAEKTLIA